MNADADDDALIARIRDGDEAALRPLFDRYEARVRARVERRIPADLKRKFAVEDILQEARLTAYVRIGDFESRGEGAFGAWLEKIALNKLREEIRRFRATRRRGDRQEVTKGARPDTVYFEGQDPSPSQFAMGRELELRLEAAMATLPEDYRRALDLVQAQRRTLREAAEEMGRSHEAMKKLYARAVAKLAAILSPEL
ncbi:MAG: sigma-70 family RNA polymerase sigma factor [Planctomycetota bacterium]